VSIAICEQTRGGVALGKFPKERVMMRGACDKGREHELSKRVQVK